jgi:hypothetical protein
VLPNPVLDVIKQNSSFDPIGYAGLSAAEQAAANCS